MKLKKSFINYCENNLYEVNEKQLEIISKLELFYKNNFQKSFFSMFFKKNSKKFGFYLAGDVGVGKTMILDFFYNQLHEKKLRLHFNEFMIKFHEFNFKNKDKETSIKNFVRNLEKKAKLIFFDEFQVTNIVDAMILGRLFKKIFDEKIKVIFTSNIKIKDLYKDGLQREQFIPFIKILEKNSYENELVIEEDYRINKNLNLERFLSPLDQSTNFRSNKFFRKVTKNKKKSSKELDIKGRKIVLEKFYEGIARFKFKELFDRNFGSEDYLKIANNCDFIFVDELPNFSENNSNQQQRFITFIDIIYDKNIPLMITSNEKLQSIKSSKSLELIFKRTISRIYELTSLKYDPKIF
tara:strand:+ start:2096 stop:3154 length:1059 start_codon:yes stop_codon:yes gene_type:complete